MARLTVHVCIMVSSILFFPFCQTVSAKAASGNILVLHCTDIAKSNWTGRGENHQLIAPDPASGNELLNGIHTVVIDQSTRRAFIEPGDQTPNNPVDNPAFGPLKAVITEVAIHISNTLPLNPAGATFVNVTIDRRTGLYFETRELYNDTKQVMTTSEVIRVCGTNKTKF